MSKDEPIAVELAKKQRDISVAEFFERNRHLLGFDNKRKALLTVVKEAVDNSIDACEEARILPEIKIEIVDMQNDRFKISVEDNGPGIVKKQIPSIFAKLLYGSKFHRMRQSLTADQSLLIEKDGKVEITKIGDFVDAHLVGEGEQNISDLKVRVPAFNWKNYNYSFKPVSHVIKHKQENEIYEIILESGRKIKVTGCHSLFTLNKEISVVEAEARNLKEGDHIIVPKKIPEPQIKNSICLLDYISLEEAKKQWWYVYGFEGKEIAEFFRKAEVIHKRTSKSRKFYRFESNGQFIDVLDDSYKQYLSKGFLPLHLVIETGFHICEQNYVKTYHHGQETKIPLYWSITPQLMRFLGFFVAEGHSDKRQIAFTFGSDEKEFVKEISDFAINHGMNYTIENRDRNAIRIKVFGGLISTVISKLCGKGAKNKKIPDFVFSSNYENRQHFLDALYQGDGHKFKERNQLTHSTVSETLANQVMYLWLFQGVVAHQHTKIIQGLGKTPSVCFVTNIYGYDINKSFVFEADTEDCKSCDFIPKEYLKEFKPLSALSNRKQILKSIGLGYTESQYSKYTKFFEAAKNTVNKNILLETVNLNKHNLNFLEYKGLVQLSDNQILLTQKFNLLEQKINIIEKFLNSDLCLLKIKSIKKLDIENQWVYDLSVPECENFVAGFGGVAAHNSRGQQGIGISAAVLYAQLTTGRPAKILSKISPKHPAVYTELNINTQTNSPVIVKEEEREWKKEQGTRVELDIEAVYQKGDQSVDTYLKETAIANPHVTLIYTSPKSEQFIFARATDKLPAEPKEIKPHPYGVEHGILQKMISATECRTLQAFLTQEFSRVGPETAKEICSNASLQTTLKPRELVHAQVEQLMHGIKNTKIISPSTDCIVPIGEELLEKGLKKEVNAEFYTAVARSPDVYKGIPFVVEVALAYGGEQPSDESARLLRFANRVPLLYQQSACATFKSVVGTNWKSYGIQQSGGALPQGPLTIAISLVSVWPPFTSEAKEAIAHYPEIIKEIKLALQDAGRKLGAYVNKKKRAGIEQERVNIFERYIPEVADSLSRLTGENKNKLIESMKKMLEKNKEFIQQNKGELKGEVEPRPKGEKGEKQATLKGTFEEEE